MHLISVIIVNSTKYTSLKQLLKTEAVSQLNVFLNVRWKNTLESDSQRVKPRPIHGTQI